MNLLSKEAILAADDLPREIVSVPEWGGQVYVRTMIGTDRDAFEASLITRDSNTSSNDQRMHNVRARLVSLTLCSESGERLFQDGDIDALGRKSARALDRVFAVAQRLKDAVREATGLSCSVAVSPNKLLSKIGSDLDKPDGLTLLTADDVPARIWPLPASRINGIGPKASARLADMNIQTVGELAATPPETLCEAFGRSYGLWLHQAAHGIDERPVVVWREPKSISRETTFERDLHPRRDRETLGAHFTRLCEQLAADLLRKGYVGRNVGVKLRYDDFHIVTRSLTLPEPTRDPATIRLWAGRCLKTVPLDQRLRLLGVKMAALSSPNEAASVVVAREATLPLFE